MTDVTTTEFRAISASAWIGLAVSLLGHWLLGQVDQLKPEHSQKLKLNLKPPYTTLP